MYILLIYSMLRRHAESCVHRVVRPMIGCIINILKSNIAYKRDGVDGFGQILPYFFYFSLLYIYIYIYICIYTTWGYHSRNWMTSVQFNLSNISKELFFVASSVLAILSF